MTIHIKKKNRGKFNALKKRTGKSTEELTHSKNPLTRKRAIFAQNAKKWKHADGGTVQEQITDILMKYATGGGVFDSSSGTMLEKGSSVISGLGDSLKQGYSPELQERLNYDPNVNTIFQNYQNNLNISEQLTDKIASINALWKTMDDIGSGIDNLGSSNPLWKTMDDIGSGIAKLGSPNPTGEKTQLGQAWTDIWDPSDTVNTGGLGLWDSITGKKDFNWTDLWSFTLPILGGQQRNKDLKLAASRAQNESKRREVELANAGWQGYTGKHGGRVPFPYGGLTPFGTDIEIERGEVTRDPNTGSMMKVPNTAPTHEQGGVDATLEPGTEVYGKWKVKSGRYKGKQYKEAADDIRKKIAALEKQLMA